MTRNVVVLCLDTVREDYFRTFAPRLRETTDVRFTQCRAASAWSTPSHASMLTGRLPHDHGVHVHAPDFEPLAGETFLDDLPHRSVGVSANVYAGSAHGFDTLFDEFVDVSRYHRYPDGLNPAAFVREHADDGAAAFLHLARAVAESDAPLRSLANVGLYRLNDAVRHGSLGGPELFDDGAAIVGRETLARVDDEPFVAFANVMDAHEPHRTVRAYDNEAHSVPDDWDSEGLSNADVIENPDAHASDLRKYRTLYAAAIDYLDRWTVSFIDRLASETDRETTVVVTADHGENLGYPADDGLFGHLASLSEGVLHVPLCIVNPPTGYPAEVDAPVSHLSLPELVAGLARGETPDVTSDRVAAEVVGLTPNNSGLDGDHWDRLRRCVYDGTRKWSWDSGGDARALDLDTERPCWQRERTGTSESVPEWADERFRTDAASAKAAAAERATDGPEEVDEDTRQRLADLGYR